MTNTVSCLSESEVHALVHDWFAALDQHSDVETILPLFAGDRLGMIFPEGPVCGIDGLRGWYAEVIGKFFDQTHDVRDVRVTATGDGVRVHVTVHWRAKTWEPPAPTSQSLAFEAVQEWLVVPGNNRPVIRQYEIKTLTPL
jgi:ketosteroid isomerase-like protein